MRKAVLVYQCGIANVFEVERFSMSPKGRGSKRLLQHAYSPCVWFARGLVEAGWDVRTANCEECGDIAQSPWNPGRGDIFRESRSYVNSRKAEGVNSDD